MPGPGPHQPPNENGLLGQLAQALLLELLDDLLRQPQALRGLADREVLAAAGAEAELDDLALLVGQGGQGSLDGALALVVEYRLLDPGGLLGL